MNIKIGNKDVKFVRSRGEVVYPNYVKDGLVLWYDFSGMENSGVKRGVAEDLSGNGNDGVLENFAFDAGSGYADNGLEFDGIDDYVQGNEEMCFDNTNFTMEFVWDMKEEPKSGYRSIGSFGNSYTLIGFHQNNSLYVFYRGEGGGVAPFVVFILGLIPTEVGKINYTVLFGNDNLEISLYINGEFYETRDMVGKMLGEKALNRTRLGGTIGNGDFSKQAIYSFRKYNRTLTPEEIAHNFKIDKHRFNIQD